MPVDPTASRKMQGDITVGVRPEAWRLVSESEGGLPVEVTVVEELGADALRLRHQRRRGHARATSSSGSAAATRCTRATRIYVTTDPHHVHVFDTDTGERLSE